MKNKFAFWLLVFWLFFACSCYPDITQQTFSTNEVDMIIQEFTSARIHQHLYSGEEPKDNASLMVLLIKQHGYSYNKFIEKFKMDKPELYKKLFVKAENTK